MSRKGLRMTVEMAVVKRGGAVGAMKINQTCAILRR
jgi:hypothetical protein